MRNKYLISRSIMMAVFILLTVSFTATASSVPRMATDQLKSQLGGKELLVLDVRSNSDWGSSTDKIAGAERVDPGAVDQWASNYDKEKTIVLYCA